jgi:hypothetical protein
MIAFDLDILTAAASAGDRGIVPGSALLLGLTLALRRP